MKKGFARILYKQEICLAEINFETNVLELISGSYFQEYKFIEKKISFFDPEIKYLPPTLPSKIVCLGLNYFDHAKELNMQLPKEPIIFIKPNSAVIGDKDKIIYPQQVKQLDYEGEIAVVIKNKCKNVDENDVYEYILGYTCLNDVTARDLQKIDVQWTRAKSFDTFAPIGPYIVSGLEIDNLDINTFLNDKIVQSSNTKNMIFKVECVISYISNIMTLYPGDIISLGTPPGVGPMNKGDKIVVSVEKIGELTNYVS